MRRGSAVRGVELHAPERGRSWWSIHWTAAPTRPRHPLVRHQPVRGRPRRTGGAGGSTCPTGARSPPCAAGSLGRRRVARAHRVHRAGRSCRRHLGAAARVARVEAVPALGAVALDLCAVAEGTLDGYVDASGPSAHGAWDYLGGALVCAEAGAVVADALGRDLNVLDPAARRTPVAAGTPGTARRAGVGPAASGRNLTEGQGTSLTRVPARVMRAFLLVWGRVPRLWRRWIVRLVAPSFTVGAACVIERDDGSILLVGSSTGTAGAAGWIDQAQGGRPRCARREVGRRSGSTSS